MTVVSVTATSTFGTRGAIRLSVNMSANASAPRKKVGQWVYRPAAWITHITVS